MSGNIIIRKVLSHVLSACGVFAAFNRHRLQDKAFILMYHRVLCTNALPELYVQPGMYVTSRSFDRQIFFLKKNYQVLFLEELINKIKNGENIGGCCAITLDDGWLDNYTNAFPIFKKYQVPATVFLATAYVGTKRLFWQEEICRYLEVPPAAQCIFPDSPAPVLRFHNEIVKFAHTNRDIYLDKVIEVLKGYSPDERKAILEYFRGMDKSQEATRLMLSWEEADEMRRSGLIAFGAHTVEHEILDQLQIPNARNEISQSKRDIELRLGVKVATFAYPNGNYNEHAIKILQECDFKCAVTTRSGFLTRDMPLMEIPRIGIHEDISSTIPMFQGRILLEKF